MNKIMITLAAATLACSAMADAQFYEMQLTVKTTLTKSGKVKMVACDCRTDTNTLYRKQGSVKIKGVVWGCDCGTLNKEQPFTKATDPFGYIFWNETTKQPMSVKLEWPICNRIDSTATKAEVVWTLTTEDGSFRFTGAGFGTIKDTATKDPCKLINSWFPTLSGNCAGWMTPGAVITKEATPDDCTWCQKIPGKEAETAIAKGFGVCSDCSACTLMTGSAATGTWRVKYNAQASKKLMNSERVTDVYRFPSYVKDVME